MIHTLPEYVFIFFAYAFLGWCMETIYMSFREKRVTKRGFLLGPYCPIYGVGLVAITMLLQDLSNNFWRTFLLIILLCSLLEYMVSVLMERLFHTRWWDYHDMKFNIRGRICLETTLPFGILGSFALYYMNPFFMGLFHRMPYSLTFKILTGLTILFALDLAVSVRMLHKLSLPEGEEDHTAEISRRVREAISKHFE